MARAFARINLRSTLIASSILAFLYTPQCLAQTDDRACYDSNNKLLPDQRPCVSPETKSISHCCSTVDTCLSDTLCLSQWGTLYVGSCTVKDWSNGNNGRGDCPKYCRTQGADIGLCENKNAEWEFCCDALAGHEACCAGDRFSIQNVTNQYLDQRPWSDGAAASASPGASPSASSSSAAEASQCPALAKSINYGAQLGLGLGLGIPLLIALGLLVWENRKRRRAEAQLMHHNAPAEYTQNNAAEYRQDNVSGYAPVHMYEADGGKVNREMPETKQVHELGHEVGEHRRS